MPDSKDPNQETPSPSFRTLAEQARAEQLDDLSGDELPGDEDQPGAEVATTRRAAPTEPSDEEAELTAEYIAKLPPKVRARVQKYWDDEAQAARFRDELTPFAPLLQEIHKDPALRRKLEKLSEKQFRDWLLAEAMPIYEEHFEKKPPVRRAEPTVKLDPETQGTLSRLAKDLDERDNERLTQQHIEFRKKELKELQHGKGRELYYYHNPKTDPDAERKNRQARSLAQHLLTNAERWSRAEGRVIPLGEVYADWKQLYALSHPPTAEVPAGSPEISPAAPASAEQGRDAALALLRRSGGFRGLQDRLQNRGR